MSLILVSDLWQEIKRFIGNIDRQEAADTVVNLLIDNDFAAEDILQIFKGDNEIKKALQSYLHDTASDEDIDEDDEDDYDGY